ncbi:CAP domain-containing protein [Stieleria marina]|uniref:Cysteine-rich secretory protein family protein n=1 Tax=Stieleria marina TaxID=1930275 RepID=A0A517NZF6_9BACT|nr:Cysteine-rich secretory protein family protein [Planctomycetes bacterium K23_9]
MVRTLTIVAASLMLGTSFGSISPVSAQGVVYSSPTFTTPSTTTGQVCAKCGRIHGSSAGAIQSSVVQSGVTNPSPAPYTSNAPSSYSPVQQTSYSSGGTSNVLAMLNAQRARQGVGALSYDPALQAVAQRRAQAMASRGLKSHPPGSFAPGRYEGVGWSSSFSPSGVSACYTSSPSMRYAGAAMATGRDGVYFAVVYR